MCCNCTPFFNTNGKLNMKHWFPSGYDINIHITTWQTIKLKLVCTCMLSLFYGKNGIVTKRLFYTEIVDKVVLTIKDDIFLSSFDLISAL